MTQQNIPCRSLLVSQCALKTTIPLGEYFLRRVGPKSFRNPYRGPPTPWYRAIASICGGFGVASKGDPWAKKKAGMFSGVAGNDSKASRHLVTEDKLDILDNVVRL